MYALEQPVRKTIVYRKESKRKMYEATLMLSQSRSMSTQIKEPIHARSSPVTRPHTSHN